MNKNTLTHYGWLVAVIIIIAILISLATPFARVIKSNIEGVVGGFGNVAQNAFDNTPPAQDSDQSYVEDNRSGPVLAPQQTWYKGSTAKSAIKTINILTSYTPSETPDEQWIADAAGSGSVMCYVEGDTLTIAGDGSDSIKLSDDSSQTFANFTAVENIKNASNFNTSDATTFNRMFYKNNALKTVDVSHWDTGNVTDTTAMFYNCFALESLDVSRWDTSNVTNMEATFYMRDGVNTALKTLDVGNWNLSKVTLTKYLFNGLQGITTLSVADWDVSSVTDMTSMFRNCTALTKLDVGDWGVGSVVDMSSMFHSCSSLTNLDVSKWNLTGTTDISFMFHSCSSLGTLDVADWDVSDVTTFSHLFAHSYVSGIDVSKWDTSSATNMNGMFHTVQNETIDVSSFDTSKVFAFGQMFESNHNLTKIYGLENFDTSNGIDFWEMFRNCPKLRELDLSSFDTRNAKDGIDLGDGTGESGGLFDMISNNYLHKITLGKNFVFEGDGTTANPFVMPKPYDSSTWYTADGTAYAPENVPSGTANTYYANMTLAEQDKVPDTEPDDDGDTGESETVTVSGEYVAVDDVHSVSHDLTVSLSSDTLTDFSGVKVTRTGKNLLDVTKLSASGDIADLTTDAATGSLSFTKTSGASTSSGTKLNVYLPAGSYTISGANNNNNTAKQIASLIMRKSSNSALVLNASLAQSQSSHNFEIVESGLYTIWIVAPYSSEANTTISLSNIQLELGGKTNFEPYSGQVVSANADGSVSGLTSLSPNMTIFTNNANVTINCEYQTNSN